MGISSRVARNIRHLSGGVPNPAQLVNGELRADSGPDASCETSPHAPT